MNPCDFDLFPKLMEPFRGRRFHDVSFVRSAVGHSIADINNHLVNGIQRLPEIEQKVMLIDKNHSQSIKVTGGNVLTRLPRISSIRNRTTSVHIARQVGRRQESCQRRGVVMFDNAVVLRQIYLLWGGVMEFPLSAFDVSCGQNMRNR
ncbi:hypothetical protein TNCV_460171 [Trichonephila clavipes]|nr:hypothetical protein TNCV_460171 [Trichonephila clavipes]